MGLGAAEEPMGLTWAQEARVSLNLIIIRDIASRERGRDEAFADHRRRALSRKHAGAGQEKMYTRFHTWHHHSQFIHSIIE